MKDIINKCLPTYKVGEKLGQGIYGSVYRVNDGLKERAVKIVPLLVERSIDLPGPQALDSRVSMDFVAVQEYYSKIKGDGIVEIYDFHLVNKRVTRDHAAAELVILMEYCPENLNSAVIDNFPLKPSLCISSMFQLASLLRRIARVQGNVFIISDLKPTNILITAEGNLVIGDLGGLRKINSLSATIAAQFSPSWTAPEIMLRGNSPDTLSTVYAYGLVSYFIWEGKPPYPDADFLTRISMIRDNGAVFGRHDIPPDIRNLVSKCLSFNPKDRPNDFDEILNILSDIKTAYLKSAMGSHGKNQQPGSWTARDSGRREDNRKDSAIHQDMAGYAENSDLPYFKNKIRKVQEKGDIWRESFLGIEFVWVPEGTLVSGDTGEYEETEGFWMAIYPVTQGQWKKMMNTNPSHFAKGDNYPVERVSWNEAQSFINHLNTKHEGSYSFSLPTELQWEYAARGGGESPYEFAGSNEPEEVAWHRYNSELSTQPVGRKKPNELGIHDMCGNVLEWCGDYFNSRDYNPADSREIYRVSKGGSWKQPPSACRITHRHKAAAGLGYSDLGFRIIRTV